MRFVHEFTKFVDMQEFDHIIDPNMLTDNMGTITLSSKLNDMSFDDDDGPMGNAPF
jgi:hypothetical protein